MTANKPLQATPLRGAPELARCRGRFAPHNHADQADFRRKSLRLSRPRGLSAAPLAATGEFQ